MRFSKLVCCLAAVGLVAGGAQAQTLRIGHSHPEVSPTHLAFVAFDKKLKELSGGTMDAAIYSGSQLGGEREMAEQVLNGALDISMVGGQQIENLYAPFAVLNVPYLFRSFEHVQKFIKSDAAQKLLLDAPLKANKGFKGLYLETCGPRSFYAKKAIKQPGDLAGVKMRVPESQVSIDTVKYLGGQPTPLASQELYSALQQGVVDGAENNFVYYSQSRHFEVAPVFSLDEHSMPPNCVIFSQDTWEGLTPEQQKWVSEAAIVARDTQMDEYLRQMQIELDQVKANGITLVEVDKAPFVEKTKAMLEAAAKKPGCQEIVDAIQAIK